MNIRSCTATPVATTHVLPGASAMRAARVDSPMNMKPMSTRGNMLWCALVLLTLSLVVTLGPVSRMKKTATSQHQKETSLNPFHGGFACHHNKPVTIAATTAMRSETTVATASLSDCGFEL